MTFCQLLAALVLAPIVLLVLVVVVGAVLDAIGAPSL